MHVKVCQKVKRTWLTYCNKNSVTNEHALSWLDMAMKPTNACKRLRVSHVILQRQYASYVYRPQLSPSSGGSIKKDKLQNFLNQCTNVKCVTQMNLSQKFMFTLYFNINIKQHILKLSVLHLCAVSKTFL
jgi:hypothetical protein